MERSSVLCQVWWSPSQDRRRQDVAPIFGNPYKPIFYRLEDGRHVQVSEAFEVDYLAEHPEETRNWPDAVLLGYGYFCCHGIDGGT